MSTSWWRKQIVPNFQIGYLCLYIIIITCMYVYHHILVHKYGDYIATDIPELDVAKNAKCSIKYSNCEYDRLTGWGIGRFLIFLFVGLYNPDDYSTIVLYSSIMGAMSYANNGIPRPYSNFITNMVGYTIGSNVRQLIKPREYVSEKAMFT